MGMDAPGTSRFRLALSYMVGNSLSHTHAPYKARFSSVPLLVVFIFLRMVY